MKPLTPLFSGLVAILLLIGCNSSQDTNKAKDQIESNPTDNAKLKNAESAQSLTIDDSLLKKYTEAYQNDTLPYEKKFLSKLLGIIKKFDGKRLDTTLLAVGDIDGDGDRDTIFSRVYYFSDSIYVDSKWIKNNNIIWHYKYVNPFDTDYNSDLLNSGFHSTSIWVTFAIGIEFGTPEFYSRHDFEGHDSLSNHPVVIALGIRDLKAAGIKINDQDYGSYLQ